MHVCTFGGVNVQGVMDVVNNTGRSHNRQKGKDQAPHTSSTATREVAITFQFTFI